MRTIAPSTIGSAIPVRLRVIAFIRSSSPIPEPDLDPQRIAEGHRRAPGKLNGSCPFALKQNADAPDGCLRRGHSARGVVVGKAQPGELRVSGSRSEEHTSELQSPCNLVC